MEEIIFHSEDIDYQVDRPELLAQWLTTCIEKEKKLKGAINFIFCSDEYLLKINQDYLNHDYFTDVITFDYTEEKVISGDIFISIDRVNENAKENGVSFENELHRVIIHGVLHLMGYKDSSPAEKEEIRAKEDFYLALQTH